MSTPSQWNLWGIRGSAILQRRWEVIASLECGRRFILESLREVQDHHALYDIHALHPDWIIMLYSADGCTHAILTEAGCQALARHERRKRPHLPDHNVA